MLLEIFRSLCTLSINMNRSRIHLEQMFGLIRITSK